ncbi:19761_t:CDS:2 [Entrophospora sp. SA101]|nr:19761_t:CDS:2 [Entrophospora sp. SA101]
MSYVTTELISENQEEPNTFQEAEELEVDTELISEELLLTSLSESSFEDDMEEELLIDETLSPLEKISLYVRTLVLSAFPKPEFERYFIPILKNFSTDNVVNVRITLVRLIRDLCRIEQYYQDPMSKSQIIDMIKQLAEDPDFDI